jgi:peptidoglycan/LPS O-acetylase OafA/YrhL
MSVAVPHRQDIQGLRALAVLAVVSFHAGLPLPGGFVGVDMFFVISGFVIVNMLMREFASKGKLSLRNFYSRRFFRLTPPLASMLTATMLLSIIFESPFGPQLTTMKTAASSMLLSANVFIAGQMGYFDPRSDLNPLLHTWSLSVEEQIYLVMPLLIVLVWKRFDWKVSRRPSFIIFGAIMVMSFGISVLSTYSEKFSQVPERLGPNFAFYSPITRVWEFLVGALLAQALFGRTISQKRGMHLLGLIGFGLVFLSVFVIDGQSDFPGLIVLVPVVGTLVLICIGTVSNTVYSRWLSNRILTYIGDRSYSMYLWHWPFVVLSGAIFPNYANGAFVATLVSFVPAYYSYKFLESPSRRAVSWGTWPKIRLGALCLLFPLCLALVAVSGVHHDWWMKWSQNSSAAELKIVKVDECADATFNPARCTFHTEGDRGTVLLVGDSQSYSYGDGVIAASNQLGYSAVVTSESGCPFLTLVSTGEHPVDCKLWQSQMLEWALQNHPVAVVIANRAAGYTRFEPVWRNIRDETGSIGWDDQSVTDIYERGLDGVVKPLRKAGIAVIILQNIPEPTVVERGQSIFSKLINRANNDSISVDYSQAILPRLFAMQAESHVANRWAGTELFDPLSDLCPEEKCIETLNGESMYLDSYHLSKFGSTLLVPGIAEAIQTAILNR